MFSFLNFNKKDGSLMIESLVGISLIIIGLFGLFSLISKSLSRSVESVHKIQAAYLAAEGVEVVKNIIDINQARMGGFLFNLDTSFPLYISYDTFDGGTLNSTDTVFFTTSSGPGMFFQRQDIYAEPTIFKRYVRVSGSGDLIRVTSTVLWAESDGRNYDVNLVQEFKNWRPNTSTIIGP
jgi:hypothetical protein